ncbi:MAG: hypothetical protein P8008_02580, partial [Gammaproteobacteria bacterium]
RSRTDQIRSFGRGDGHHHATPVARGRIGDPRTLQTATQSTRNVLTGYDLSKKNPVTDTSSWPYRDDSFGSAGPQKPSPSLGNGARSAKGSKKPWGW